MAAGLQCLVVVADRRKSKDLKAHSSSLTGYEGRFSSSASDDERYVGFSDARNSFVPVWLSLPPFLMLEYFVELSFPTIPSALVFPVGFLLYWAFYFIFYKPNVLEDRLSDPFREQFHFAPSLILGFILWFLQASLLEIRYLLWEAYRKPRELEAREVSEKFKKLVDGSAAAPRPAPSPSRYPDEVLRALAALGLGGTGELKWEQVHKRYRTLAKKLHPDLNDTGTQGRRFIEVDQAFRSLVKRKDLF